MNKKSMLTAIIVSIVFLMLIMPVLAEGPTNAGGKKTVEEWGIPWAPYNANAWWHSGQSISPEIFGCGTETTIVLDDVTIVVDDIPSATYDEETGEWTGTHLMWKGRYRNDDPQIPEWLTYKFWLNGSGPVRITYTYQDGTEINDFAMEFIFFGKRHTDNGWETTLQAYK